jgi:Spy/CpxP family protein refolding chaperone
MAAGDPTLVDGPILPEEFAATAKLDSKQESRYATLYQNLMSNTKADRDVARAARDKMRAGRAARQGGGMDRDQMRADRENMRPAMDNLRKSQEAFEKSLKDFLKPEQLKAYDDWKASKRSEMRAQFGGGQRPPRP